jgi:hypothetical protein
MAHSIISSKPAIAIVLLSTLLLTVCQSAILSRRTILRSSVEDTSRKLELVNKSGKNLVVDWVDPSTGQARTLNAGFVDGQSTVFDSFVNHTFAIHEPNENCDGTNGKTCAVRYITVDEREQQGRPTIPFSIRTHPHVA